MSQTDAPQASVTQPAEPKRGSPIRLIVLLGVLAIVLGAFLVDLFVMFDAVNAATVRLQAAADEMASQPHENGRPQFLSREEVAQAIGFQPTSSRVENGALIEQYRWWGALPLERRYIQVVYADPDGKNYGSYTINNRDIFGNDIDPEAAARQQQPAGTADPNATAPAPAMGGVKGPPVPQPNPPPREDAAGGEPAPDQNGSPDASSDSSSSDGSTEQKKDEEKKDEEKKEEAKKDSDDSSEQ
jgi:hypothetical protein